MLVGIASDKGIQQESLILSSVLWPRHREGNVSTGATVDNLPEKVVNKLTSAGKEPESMMTKAELKGEDHLFVISEANTRLLKDGK